MDKKGKRYTTMTKRTNVELTYNNGRTIIFPAYLDTEDKKAEAENFVRVLNSMNEKTNQIVSFKLV